jgi:hypothetical protein
MSTKYARIPVKPDTADQLSREKRYGETWDEFARRRLLEAED